MRSNHRGLPFLLGIPGTISNKKVDGSVILTMLTKTINLFFIIIRSTLEISERSPYLANLREWVTFTPSIHHIHHGWYKLLHIFIFIHIQLGLFANLRKKYKQNCKEKGRCKLDVLVGFLGLRYTNKGRFAGRPLSWREIELRLREWRTAVIIGICPA